MPKVPGPEHLTPCRRRVAATAGHNVTVATAHLGRLIFRRITAEHR